MESSSDLKLLIEEMKKLREENEKLKNQLTVNKVQSVPEEPKVEASKDEASKALSDDKTKDEASKALSDDKTKDEQSEKIEEAVPEEPKVEEPKVEEPKVEEPKVEEPKDETKPAVIMHDLGDGLHYYEEDGICYIDVDRDDEVIDEVRAKIVKASEIREFIKNGEFEKIKPYVPEDAYNILYAEYKKWAEKNRPKTPEELNTIEAKKKQISERIKQIQERIKVIEQEWNGQMKIRQQGGPKQVVRPAIRRCKELQVERKKLDGEIRYLQGQL